MSGLFVQPPASIISATQIKQLSSLPQYQGSWHSAIVDYFDPDHFEFGIGRHAFNPLGDADWEPGSKQNASGMRVIGVAGNGDAHAYSINKLRYYETANTFR